MIAPSTARISTASGRNEVSSDQAMKRIEVSPRSSGLGFGASDGFIDARVIT